MLSLSSGPTADLWRTDPAAPLGNSVNLANKSQPGCSRLEE
jgi:hypothetical protein